MKLLQFIKLPYIKFRRWYFMKTYKSLPDAERELIKLVGADPDRLIERGYL